MGNVDPVKTSDVVIVSEQKNGDKILTFWCPHCQTTHSISVYTDRYPRFSSKGVPASWHWNGSKTFPTIEFGRLRRGSCITTHIGLRTKCHIWITEGFISGFYERGFRLGDRFYRPMLRVDGWPTMPPPEKGKGKIRRFLKHITN